TDGVRGDVRHERTRVNGATELRRVHSPEVNNCSAKPAAAILFTNWKSERPSRLSWLNQTQNQLQSYPKTDGRCEKAIEAEEQKGARHRLVKLSNSIETTARVNKIRPAG
ncbi:MAG: hypothetical protein ACKO81_14505, partial [Planctomycetota bacterium]